MYTYKAVDNNGKIWVKSSKSKQYVVGMIDWWLLRRGIALELIKNKT